MYKIHTRDDFKGPWSFKAAGVKREPIFRRAYQLLHDEGYYQVEITNLETGKATRLGISN